MQSLFHNIKNWCDFKSKLSNLDAKSRGDAFESLVRFYLQIAPHYKTILKNVWRSTEIPDKLFSHLNLPPSDKGIDLIAETHRGEYWAIQCKYREDESSSLTWKEVSTFSGLAFGHCRNITFGLLCTTTEHVTSILKKHHSVGLCCIDVWMDLDEHFYNQINSLLETRSLRFASPLQPLPHQERAIESAFEHFITNGESRGKLIMPCGTGKSLTAHWIAEKIEAKDILIAVPSLALIRQTFKVWLGQLIARERDVDWICVCSDESAGKVERDDLTLLKQDLGIPCMTDPQEIAGWLKTRRGEMNIVFTTYHSGKSIAQAAREQSIEFDLAILDEAHKTVGSKSKLFSHLLYDKNIRIRNRLFMTATERRYAGESEHIASMDDPVLYGDTFALLSFKEALESNPPVLSDYRVITISVRKSEVTELIEKNLMIHLEKEDWDREVEARILASMIALRKAMQNFPIRHAVSFHNSIKRARIFKDCQDKFSALFPKYGKLDTYHVSGKTQTGERARILKNFEGSSPSLVTNAQCLAEGVDVPDIDCVLFADPRKSTVDIVQAVGRALRLSAGKEYGYVIIPIVTDDDLPDTQDLDLNDEFQDVICVPRALASNDERIIDYFRAISQGRKPSNGDLIQFEANGALARKIDLNEFIKHIELMCWKRLARLSWRPFEEARLFVRALELQSEAEWRAYCKGELKDRPPKPHDIPVAPHVVYRNMGWISNGDWLGTGTIASRYQEFMTFEDARKFVHSLGLRSKSEWYSYCNGELEEHPTKPSDLPASPQYIYKKEGWNGWGDWLGTGTIAPFEKLFRDFGEACEFARSLRLRSSAEWRAYCKGELQNRAPKPHDIPSCPNNTYRREGWIGWGDWLGTRIIATRQRQYRDFSDAREFARALSLRNNIEWRAYIKGNLPDRQQLPDDIPAAPDHTYDEWTSWGDWLGCRSVSWAKHKWRNFKEARAFAMSLGLKNQAEWFSFCRGEISDKPTKPDDIPQHPCRPYKDKGWVNWGDWLGTDVVATRNRIYRDFLEARAFVQSLVLRSKKEWRNYCRGELKDKLPKPEDIPNNPNQTYRRKGWIGWGDWLGTGTIAWFNRKYRDFEAAREFARSLGLKSQSEWRTYCKGKMKNKPPKPDDIPCCPHGTYKSKGWNGMNDWLGIQSVTRK